MVRANNLTNVELNIQPNKYSIENSGYKLPTDRLNFTAIRSNIKK